MWLREHWLTSLQGNYFLETTEDMSGQSGERAAPKRLRLSYKLSEKNGQYDFEYGAIGLNTIQIV